MDRGEIPESEARNLRFLRRLVTVLTVVMIGGIVTITALMIFRLNDMSGTGSIALPSEITLPEGETAAAFTRADDWFAIVTERGNILIYDAENGALRQTVEIK